LLSQKVHGWKDSTPRENNPANNSKPRSIFISIMATSMTQTETLRTATTTVKATTKYLKSSGSLNHLESIDLTPTIGTEFPNAKLVDLINAPNSDQLLKDLAIKSKFHQSENISRSLNSLVSERGVVFFRAQDDLTNDVQKVLVQRLGELVGKPKTSGLHIHPILNSERDLGGNDPEISTISSLQHKKFYKKPGLEDASPKKQNTASWHSDIAFESVPADYSSLRLTQLPKTGGGQYTRNVLIIVN
jgi:Taurine catabolism dioxygenase TauD, TfdA family